MKYLITMTAVALLASCSAKQNTVRLYYIPFGVETITAVTPANIEDRCQICGSMTFDSKDTIRIKKILEINQSNSLNKFDSNRARLKIILNGGIIILVDNDGGVMRSDAESVGRISQDEVSELSGIIEQ